MFKVGRIGAGYWGANLARVLNQSRRYDFRAVCDIDSKNVEKIIGSPRKFIRALARRRWPL